MSFLQALWPLGALYLVLFAAVSDLHSMRIPNWISLALLVLFVLGLPFHIVAGITGHVIVFAIACLVLAALFFAKMAGGGDVKLLAALSLWVGPEGIVPFLLVMSIVGGLMGGLGLLLARSEGLKAHQFKWTDSWLARIVRGEKVVAYGVAIAVGFVAALTKTYFSHL